MHDINLETQSDNQQKKCPSQEKVKKDLIEYEREYQERKKISQQTESDRERLKELQKLKESATLKLKTLQVRLKIKIKFFKFYHNFFSKAKNDR